MTSSSSLSESKRDDGEGMVSSTKDGVSLTGVGLVVVLLLESERDDDVDLDVEDLLDDFRSGVLLLVDVW